MTRSLNPFVHSGPVPHTHFIGREEIIDNCYSRLAGPVRSSIALSGEHGIGKTSLLHYLRRLAQQEQWGEPYTHNIFVHLDCSMIKQFTPARFWHRVLELLKEERPDLHQRIDPLLQQEDVDAIHFQRLLRRLNRQGFSLVLMLDGFTSIVKTEAVEQSVVAYFLSGLRALANHPDHPLTMLTATREHLDVLCYEIVKNKPGSRFYNNFTFESLAPFSPDEINSLFKQYLAEAGFEFDQIDRNFMHHMAGAHPALLQMASFHFFEIRRHGPLSHQAYEKIIAAFEKSARPYFSLFWEKSDPLEQIFFILIILIDLTEQFTHQLEITPEEIQDLFQQHERDIIRLVERGLVYNIEDSYQVFSAVFIWWIVREVAAENDTALTNRYKTITQELLRRAWQTFKSVAPHMTLDKVTQTLVARSGPSTRPSLTPEQPKRMAASVSHSDDTLFLPNRFEFKEEVGRGASGIVFKAFDSRLRRLVAIKSLRSDLATSAVGIHHLLKEARAASSLDHPSIVTVYDVIEESGGIFLVMEYLEGQSLADFLKEKRQLSLPEVIALVEQAAGALDYAHAEGIIHRDIKPANLIITKSDKLKLTDFGIAKVVGGPDTTQSASFKGTVNYMSPEQANKNPLDGRSDLFSLATVTFEMLSGALPWPDTGLFNLMSSIANATPRPLSDFDIPAAASLEPILQKALTKNPDERYQSGRDFVQALKEATII